MKKINVYLMIMAVLLTLMFTVGCNGEDLGAGYGDGVVEVTFIEEEQESDSSRSLVPDSYGRGNVRLVRNYEPNSLFWLYTAEHKYNAEHGSTVYATGETPRDASGALVKTPVSPDGRLGFVGFNTRMSVGDWEIKLYGYDATNQAGCTDAKKLYEATKEVTITGSSSSPVPLQRIGFTLNFTGTGDYAKRYLYVTAFDAVVWGNNSSHTGYDGIFEAIASFIKNDRSILNGVCGNASLEFLKCESDFSGPPESAYGRSLHFKDAKSRYTVTNDFIDTNGCVHFFMRVFHRGTGWGRDISDVVVVPTKPGYTTYVDGKIFRFNAAKCVGGTVFYKDGGATGFVYILLNSSRTAADESNFDVGKNCSNYFYIRHDYDGTGNHKDKYYVWNESLISFGLAWANGGADINNIYKRNVSYRSNPDSDSSLWDDYTIGGVTYSFVKDYDLGLKGNGKGNTEFLLNIPRRNLNETSGGSFRKDWWVGSFCVGTFINNLRGSKAAGCDDWYVPSCGELSALITGDSYSRRDIIFNHALDFVLYSLDGAGHRVVLSSSCGGASGTSMGFHCFTKYFPDLTYYNGNYSGGLSGAFLITPIRSF